VWLGSAATLPHAYFSFNKRFESRWGCVLRLK
jgi:hypothetical protein